jgi:hypothetical protein
VAIRAQDAAFRDFDKDRRLTTRRDEPPDVAVFVVNVVEVKNNRIVFRTENARVRAQVLPRQQPIAMPSRQAAAPALYPFVVGRAALRKFWQHSGLRPIQFMPLKVACGASSVAIRANDVTLVDLGKNC